MNRNLKSTLTIGLTVFLFLSPYLGAATTSIATNSAALSALNLGPNVQAVTPLESYNWGGYALNSTSGTVTAVTGSWTEPAVTCNSALKGPQYAAFWVGIDGLTTTTVEQTGTLAYCAKGSTTSQVIAWYEMYPSASKTITKLVISPGNVVQASVTYSSSTKKFTLEITDVTTGVSFSISKASASAVRSSAEWITETPELCSATACHLARLTNFGTMNFGSGVKDTATISGVTKPIGQWGSIVDSLTIVNYPSGKTVMATPSSLGSDSSSFSMTWHSAGP